MNRYPVRNVRIVITWKSGAKVRYTCPHADLLEVLALYTPEMSQIRRIKVTEA